MHKMQTCFFLIVLASVVKGETLTQAQLVERLQNELNYESLVLLQNFKDDCWSDLQKNTTMPILNFNNEQSYQLKNNFNRHILALVYLKSDEENALMTTLFENLDEVRSTPTMFLVQPKANLSAIFKTCFCHKMMNVVALKKWEEDLNLTYIYSYRAFPRFQIKKRRLSEISIVFEPLLNNLYHYPIIAWPMDVLPRAVIYKNTQGHLRIKGYIARLMKTYAKSLNASLEFILDKKFPTAEMVANQMDNGSVDFYLHLTDTKLKTDSIKKRFTYSKVVQIVHWNLMLPEEPVMERAKFYFVLEYFLYGFTVNVLFALLLTNAKRFECGKNFTIRCLKQFLDPVLRGVTSQSFVMPKGLTFRRIFIYWLILFCGLFNCNIYIAYLTTLFLNPPAAHRIVSYEDIRRANLKILIHTADYREMNSSYNEVFLRHYQDLVVTAGPEEFQRLRSELNPNYAYPITDTLWPLLKQKQMKLQRPIFRISKEITFSPLIIFTIPLARNSIFEESFSRFVSRTHCSGLFDYWFERTFNEMLEIGQLNYSHKDFNESSQSIILEDLIWPYLSYFIGILLSLIVFGFELLYYKWTRH